METKDLKMLEKSIKYKFLDIALLELAMTHRSHSGKNIERLEFLGDSILNFIVADLLLIKISNYLIFDFTTHILILKDL